MMSIKSLKSLLFSKRFGKLYVFVDVQLLIFGTAVCRLGLVTSHFSHSSAGATTTGAGIQFCWTCDNDIAPNGRAHTHTKIMQPSNNSNKSKQFNVQARFLTALDLISLSICFV